MGKIININTKKFLIVTKYEDYVLAPKKHTTNTGMQILAVHFDKEKLKEDEYINLFAISNQYKEFKLLQINDLNCLDFVRTSTAVTTGECFCQKKCQTVSPKILKEKISNLSPPKNPTKCTPPMVKEDPLNPFSDCVEKVDPTIEPVKKCTPPMVNADPKDPDSKCVNINALYPPNTPRPNPNSKCMWPLVNINPLDMTSPCVPPSQARPNPNSKCTPPMVNEYPLDMTSKCVPINAVSPPNTPKPNPNSKCVPPMVNINPLDTTSPCVPPSEARPNPNS